MSSDPDEQNPAGRADLLRISQGGQVTRVVDLMAFDLEVKPDQQDQFDENSEPYDTLADPYDVLALPGSIYVSSVDFTTEEGEGAILTLAAGTLEQVGSVEVLLPAGLTWADGRLLAGSLAGMLLSVQPSAFD